MYVSHKHARPTLSVPQPVSDFSSDLTREQAQSLVQEGLNGADDGELFIEKRQTESLVFDDGKLKSASVDDAQGFGLRAVSGETAAYAHATELSASAIKRATATTRAILSHGKTNTVAASPTRTNTKLYSDINPADQISFAERVTLLERVNDFARKLDSKVRQVSASVATDFQDVTIVRPDGGTYRDIRPLVRFNVSITTDNGTLQGQGSDGFGGRAAPATYLTEERWQEATREALRQALVALEAGPAPAGEMDVLLGPGWPGILLHEAIGHGLEGDFNRKGTSAFAGLMGQMIASEDVTVVDDGTLPDRRGSITIDDEGTPSRCTTLIENGKLVGFMQDRMNARLMGVAPTGNGRRQSYAHIPLPRMTNTYMLNGKRTPEEILASMKTGIYAKSFGGGQVDITSGKFVFTVTEAYIIENGKLTRPVKGATLIGSGADALKRISMVGNDMALDKGIGTCGKAGQGVPVGVGQPTLRINGLTVGGTAAA
jgi:TldD protein